MKRYFLFFTIFFTPIFSICQDALPALGTIDKEDLEMKSCPFDPEADAMYLIDQEVVNKELNATQFYLEIEKRTRIKIFNDKATEYFKYQIEFRSEHLEEIVGLEAYVYNLGSDGFPEIIKLQKVDFFETKLDKYYSEITIVFPKIKPGSVVEYKYKKKYNYHQSLLPSWYFQANIPVRYSEYLIYIPPFYPYSQQITRRKTIEISKTKEDRPGDLYIMRNIASFPHEAYVCGMKDYIQRIDYLFLPSYKMEDEKSDYQGSWEALIDNLWRNDYVLGQLDRTIANTQELDDKLKLVSDQNNKIKLIYDYVQNQMQFNGHYVYFTNDGIKAAWDKKQGNVAEINLILLKLLKNAGIKAYPMLASTRDNGRVNIKYPSKSQFDELVVYIPLDNKIYILDASNKYNPFNQIPDDLQMTYGLVCDKKINIVPIQDLSQKYKQVVGLFLNMEADGKLTGDVTISNFGYAKNEMLYKSHKNKMYHYFEDYQFKPDSIASKNNDEINKPFELKTSIFGQAEISNNYFFLPVNLFTTLDIKNPFIANNRQTNIDFNYLKDYTITGTFNIPDGFAFEELPKNKVLVMNDTSIVVIRNISLADSTTLNYKITLQFGKAVYTAEEYSVLKEFYKKMYALLEEKIVVKKK